MSIGSRKYLFLLIVCAMLGSGTAFSRDFSLTAIEQTTTYELNLKLIAVGFDEALPTGSRADLLASLDRFEADYLEREIPALGATILRVKAGAAEADVLAAITRLEALAEVRWAAPVLMYNGLEHIPGPFMYVQFEPEKSELAARAILEQERLEIENVCDWADGLYHVRRSVAGADVLDLCNRLTKSPEIAYAEPDFIRTVRAHTNDTYYNNQWYLHQASDADMDMPEAWSYETGDATVVVSICDVGVDIDHPDLNGHIETGYDAVDSDSDPNPESADDGHGTCCAGIAAAETNNATGIAGVGYNCHLLGTKLGYIIFGNSIQTNDTWIVNCINYSRDNADVMSNSWGGGSSSSTVNTAFSNARAAGLTILVSSGNGNTSVQWPATLTTVIAVGATNEVDDRCDPGDWGGGQGSNFGSQLDIVAPGNSQYATDIVGSWGYDSGSYYSDFGGTSGACPAAAGVAALVRSVDPSLTPAQVQTILQTTADDLVGDPAEDVSGFDIYMGYGRVNANAAVRYVFGAPSNLSATDDLTTVPLNWSVPWRTPVSYDIYRSTTGQFGAYSLLDNTTLTTYDDTAVSSGQTYWYKIKAVYTNGESEFSNADSGTPLIATFSPPQNLVAQSGQDGVVPVSWSVPAEGTPSEYQLYRSTTGEFGSYSLLTTVVPAAHNDLAVTNGNEYWYKAKAVYTSPAGISDFSNADGATPQAPVNIPPIIAHDPLPDFATGTGTITAISSDPDAARALVDVKMFYRVVGAVPFDSLTLAATGNPDEFAADLSGFAAESYEYYLRARDDDGAAVYLPELIPAELYRFDVGEFCGSVLAYDDGSAESFNYATGDQAESMRWAVKFTPADFPYVLCGASFAAARTIPDTEHSPVLVSVLLADGTGNSPGTLVWEQTSGSIGNMIGGFTPTTTLADVLIRDAGDVMLLNDDFYIVLTNSDPLKTEAFGRDTDSPNQHVSYFYDACDALWYSEDDTGLSTNAYPGNRIIRAHGYSLVPPELVVSRSGDDIRLDWSDTGAASYEIYSALDSQGAFTNLEGATSDTYFIDFNAHSVDELKFYRVISISH